MERCLSVSQRILSTAQKLAGPLLFATCWGGCHGFGRDLPRRLGTETHEEQADNPATRYTRGSHETTQKWSETPEITPARHHVTTKLGPDAPHCPPLPSPSTPLAAQPEKQAVWNKAVPQVLLHSSAPHFWCPGLLAGSAQEEWTFHSACRAQPDTTDCKKSGTSARRHRHV